MRRPAGSVSPEWLLLREPADAAARATDLVDELRRSLASDKPTVVHDLGSGTGSMARWLAPQLAGPQQWILHDRDAALLRRTSARRISAADGAMVTVEPRVGDLTELADGALSGATLVTASALLDVLTAHQMRRIVTAVQAAGCPALFALTVRGHVDLCPSDPLDGVLGEAFNDHQRRAVDGGRLLGPDAGALASDAFADAGADVLIRPSVWRLDVCHADLLSAWLRGWIDAACEQRPELAAHARGYARRRADDLSAGRLRVAVHHQDLLALPGA